MPNQALELKPLDAIEMASSDELASLQLTRLKWSLNHAYANVPHFKRKFDQHGVHPDDLKTLADLKKFPFTLKNDLRDNYPFGLLAVERKKLIRVHASSGSTGQPTVVGYTKNDIDVWANLMARSIRAAGGTSGDMVHIAYGYGLFTGGLGAHYGAERLGCTVIPMSGGQTEKQVQLIQDFEPKIIMVTPTYMLNILDEMERQGMNPAQSSLKIGIFGAEPWTDELRLEIETRTGIKACDIYGLSELMGPGIASECVQSQDGAVIWEDHFYPEIINPETGEVLPEGSPGELVLTSLTKEALPMIRYRTRDLTKLLPPTSRGMRRMGRIFGRSDDMLIIRGVNVFPTQIEAVILKNSELTPHFVLEISKDGHLDALKVMVERHPDSFGQPERIKIMAQELQKAIKSHVGVSTTVEVKEPMELARSTGKMKRVIDKR